MESLSALKFHTLEQEMYYVALVKGIKSHYHEYLQSIVVFGSMASGTNRMNSDCDVLIILANTNKLSRGSRIRDFGSLEKPLQDLEVKMNKTGVHMEVSPVILYSDEAMNFNPLYLDMINNHVRLYDKDNFFSCLIENMREKTRAWGSSKHESGNGWYWVIKKDINYGEIVDYDK